MVGPNNEQPTEIPIQFSIKFGYKHMDVNINDISYLTAGKY